MVESAAGGRGAEEGRLPYTADGPGKPEEMDRRDPQAVAPHGENDESCPTEEESRHGRASSRGVQSVEAFAWTEDEQHQQGHAGPAVAKLPNGNVECVSRTASRCDSCDQANPAKCCSLDRDSKVFVNGELLSGSECASLNADVSPASSTSFVLCVPKPQLHDATQDMGAVLHQNTNVSSNVSSGYTSSSTLSSLVQREATDGGQESGMTSKNCSSAADSESMLRSLRTFSPSDFRSEPLPSNPEDRESCPGPNGQQEDSLTLMDVSLNSRNTYEISRRQSAPDNMPGVLTVASSDPSLKQKKQGLSEIFGRGLFSRKQREAQSAPGWKLFGKVPLRESPPKDSKTIQQDSNPGNLTSVSTPNLLSAGEYEAKASKGGHSPPQPSQGRRKNLEFEPLSTTALILEDRPANLPAKPEEEAQRHRQEYDEMVAEAKKRELKEAQKKKQQMKERFKQEDNISNAMVVWNTEILPNWDSMRGTRRVKDLWWQGLPPNVRGKVWSLAIGNELNITPELYEIFLSRAKERWRTFRDTGCEVETEDSGASVADRESSLDLIKLDISRTFPSLFIFQKGGPYHDLLHSVLGAYTCYRPDVGYVQGMSFIAAVLILNMEEADAFIAFANLLNKPCQMAFFRVDHELMLKYFAAFQVFFEENLPKLFSHFQSSSLTPDLYLIDWIFTLYSKSLPLDVACRVWDVFCRDGEEFLFRTGLGILRLYEEVLLCMDFIHIAQFLTRLPDDVSVDRLFGCISCTQMTSNNRKWTQVFSALMKDKEVDKSSSPSLKSS
ncbi:TBC1 domain family member 12 isoform X2 [Colossoma macropomum]|uniref:TBC1 domain family member 12 isoform X2 n=1 Tax=Colossoma macropomum TaxID=42526 RepID=UPI001863CF78|nr:TBC1 domain family member 12 isoform X2 [Colossoma macropomum]